MPKKTKTRRFRVPESEDEKLDDYAERAGFDSFSAWVRYLIRRDMKRIDDMIRRNKKTGTSSHTGRK